MRFLLTTFLAKTCFVIAGTSIATAFTLFSSVYGQSERRVNEVDSSEITISMKRDGFPCGYVPSTRKI